MFYLLRIEVEGRFSCRLLDGRPLEEENCGFFNSIQIILHSRRLFFSLLLFFKHASSPFHCEV